MCSFTLGHWIIPFLPILVVQIGTMKCFYCPQKDMSVVPWDSLSPDDQKKALGFRLASFRIPLLLPCTKLLAVCSFDKSSLFLGLLCCHSLYYRRSLCLVPLIWTGVG